MNSQSDTKRAARKRQRRVRAACEIVTCAAILATTVFLIHMEAQYQEFVENLDQATETAEKAVVYESTVKYTAPQVVVLPEPEPVVEVEEIATPTYSEAELEALALVIYQEAGGDMCSDETRLMVGNVVMNRVADPRYPDTIEEVLLQKRQYGRLYWTGLVWPERHTNPGEAHAVARAYECAERILSGERVLPDDVIFQAEFPQGTETVAEQDGFYFCR